MTHQIVLFCRSQEAVQTKDRPESRRERLLNGFLDNIVFLFVLITYYIIQGELCHWVTTCMSLLYIYL